MSSTFKVKRISLRKGVSCFVPPKPSRVRRGLIQEKFNGQGSEAKQPRAEETKAAEAEGGGCAVGLDRPARAAGGTNTHEEKVGNGRSHCRDHPPEHGGDERTVGLGFDPPSWTL
jgi:hypothetical protein